MDRIYNWKNIRTLLTKGFTDGELRRFCQDEPIFEPVHNELTPHIGKAEIIDQLIGHAKRQLQGEVLLNWAQKHNSARYEMHRPYMYVSEEDLTRIPICGVIAAGEPIMVFNDNESEYIYISRKYIKLNKLVYLYLDKGLLSE